MQHGHTLGAQQDGTCVQGAGCSGPNNPGSSPPGSPLREYQQRAVTGIHKAWDAGHRSVCLVAPTGSGKTVMGADVVWRARAQREKVLFVVHRRELVRQTAERLRKMFGRLDVGIIAAGEDSDPYAPIQVGMVQTLLARNALPDAGLIILDECHHYAAADWVKLAEHYARARCLGLTATPERRDGKPLGDIFQRLIVAASYSELLRDGHLCACRVFQPPEAMSRALALDPLEAWKRHADGARTFAFCGTVESAYELAARFREAGVSAGTIEADTKKSDRDELLDRFGRGEVTVLTNCYALTEGVDVPAARCVLLARGADHVGIYLQIAGRVLRPHPSKPDAILIDLTGATLKHGLPTEDRTYSLDGDGIRRASVQPLRNCLHCGATLPASVRVCPECGNAHIPAEVAPPKIYSLELREVYAGADTPSDAKGREYQRLRELGRSKGWSLYFVQKEYKKLFGELPVITDATDEEKAAELARLGEIVRERGYKPGYAKIRYKEMFGEWPRRDS